MLPAPGMAHWLCVASPGNWTHVKRLGKWAVSPQHESLLNRSAIGDRCVMYLTSTDRTGSCLASLFRITSHPLEENPSVPRTLFDRLYPKQVEIAIDLEASEAVPFKPLVQRLAFIRNPHNWGAYLQGSPMRPLSDQDYQVLASAVEMAVRGEGRRTGEGEGAQETLP